MKKLCAMLAVCQALLNAGCFDSFGGSHIQLNLKKVGPPCLALLLNEPKLPGYLKCQDNNGAPLSAQKQRLLYHYELWATVKGYALVQLASFTVQPHLIVVEQKDLEARGVILHNGEPFRIGGQNGKKFSEMTAEEKEITESRMKQAEKVYAITSYSSEMYESDGITLREGLYLGNHSQLTFPHNGIYYGQIESTHPFGTSYNGGASIKTDYNLDELNSLWITIEEKDPARENPKPSDLVYLWGKAFKKMPGVTNVKAYSPYKAEAEANFAVISDLAEDDLF